MPEQSGGEGRVAFLPLWVGQTGVGWIDLFPMVKTSITFQHCLMY